jgi:hypothetical protein
MQNDAELLERLDGKLQLVRDRVQGVAEGYANGMFLWGEGGTGKSFVVEQTLKELGRAYRLTNSRLTGRGLFDLLQSHPDTVHVVEDCETLFSDKTAEGVLRSALWGQAGDDGHQERLVSWGTAPKRQEFIFTGGIIMVMNCRLANTPQLRAVTTRIPCLEYRATDEELAALMRDIASRGYRFGKYRLTPEEAGPVVEEIISRSSRVQRGLDLRLLTNTFADYLQWRNGSSESDWKTLLDSRLKGRVVPPPEGSVSRAERKRQEQAIARRIARMPREERLRVWEKETGKSEKALYRRLKEVGAAPHILTSQVRGNWTWN